MAKLNDQDYLLTQQYQDDANLQARIAIHRRFSTNTYPWFLWVFDQLNIPATCRILELGCGPGDLWLENAHRIAPEWDITLSDFSAGMVRRAKQNLSSQRRPFTFGIIDAQTLPFHDRSFDAVFANNMLYHMPDRQKALAEIRRVLRHGGQLYATTVGETHMQELPRLVVRFDPSLAANNDTETNEFTLESGYAQLARCFSQVETYRQDNALLVTEVDPLVDYVLSSFMLGVGKSRRAEFKSFVECEMAYNDGVIRISKDSGMFAAVRK
ncbi:MAG: methyltransferase domain-containing protein [Anaerolineales bacterium]|jgi:ubiquinone/menaquinone biosynthesis C-methylase UbiE